MMLTSKSELSLANGLAGDDHKGSRVAWVAESIEFPTYYFGQPNTVANPANLVAPDEDKTGGSGGGTSAY